MINSYAEEKWKVNKPAKRQLVFATWKLVQNSGILRYLATVAGMALQPKPKVRDYWSRLDIYHLCCFVKAMPREWFDATVLHVSDVNEKKAKEKIEPFLNLR